jgi:hypothetical protein
VPADLNRKPRLLTKSRFKMAQECPTKLAFTGKREYGNTMENDPFLKALAEGGFQVGALAKLYFPGGKEIETLDYEKALSETNNLLAQENAIIYEAALKFENLFVRVDILVKSGKQISLYEVKASSFDPNTDHFYQKRSKEKKLLGDWEPYLYDIAFQAFVAQNAMPDCSISPYLYLVNKTVEASVDGLNQNFLLSRSLEGRARVKVKKELKPSELGTEILIKVPVGEEVAFIHGLVEDDRTFAERVAYLATHYKEDKKIQTPLSGACKTCEYRIGQKEKDKGLKSGFDECWKKALGNRLHEPLVFDLWDNRSSQKLMDEGIYLLKDLTVDDITQKDREGGTGISRTERQWLQVEKVIKADKTPFLDVGGLAQEMSTWKYPLHFIDFETAQVAIPFNKGKRPYEQIAFQFSHHIVHENGKIEHAGEFINSKRGVFPNFDFVKALKSQLDKDSGTIFRFAAHENTVLCKIHDQLKTSNLPKGEVDELCEWIRTITKKRDESKKNNLWEGARNMVDMRELVLRFYYHPLTEGSNSLKYVLPATLNQSSYLKDKYSKPIYGGSGDIQSKNYRNKQWIQLSADGKVLDPYKTLEPIFSPEEDRIIEALYPETAVADGGGAMMAYARMQFTEMDEHESQRISQALLRYCELDTFAMVMLFEYWKSEALPMRKKSVA